MGFHICEYCTSKEDNQFQDTSSGDTLLIFDSDRSWKVPDMILHYVADHGWHPGGEFVDDVMNHKLLDSTRYQTKSVATRLGYLQGPFEKAPVPDKFIENLETLLKLSCDSGMRTQFRSAS